MLSRRRIHVRQQGAVSRRNHYVGLCLDQGRLWSASVDEPVSSPDGYGRKLAWFFPFALPRRAADDLLIRIEPLAQEVLDKTIDHELRWQGFKPGRDPDGDDARLRIADLCRTMPAGVVATQPDPVGGALPSINVTTTDSELKDMAVDFLTRRTPGYAPSDLLRVWKNLKTLRNREI